MMQDEINRQIMAQKEMADTACSEPARDISHMEIIQNCLEEMTKGLDNLSNEVGRYLSRQTGYDPVEVNRAEDRVTEAPPSPPYGHIPVIKRRLDELATTIDSLRTRIWKLNEIG